MAIRRRTERTYTRSLGQPFGYLNQFSLRVVFDPNWDWFRIEIDPPSVRFINCCLRIGKSSVSAWDEQQPKTLRLELSRRLEDLLDTTRYPSPATSVQLESASARLRNQA